MFPAPGVGDAAAPAAPRGVGVVGRRQGAGWEGEMEPGFDRERV